jgi:hypothetical protein
MRVRVMAWMVGLLLSSLVAQAFVLTTDSNTRIRKQGKDISLASEIQVSGGGGHH